MKRSTNRDQPSAIELHIEELVLYGVPAAHKPLIGDAIRQELTRLIAGNGLSGVTSNHKSLTIDRIDTERLQLPADPGSRLLGQRVAQQIYRGLSPIRGVRAAGGKRHV